jgi:hypothetical protein
MANVEEMARNRVAGDYQVLAELLGNGGRVALTRSVPFLPGTWNGAKLDFNVDPANTTSVADTTSVFLRTGANSERINPDSS